MDALTLNKWTRFAEKGGIGKAQGRHDVLATVKGDLMFMKDDIIVVLKVLTEDDSYLGACEGVIGRFNHSDVVFLQKQLKKPVFVPHKSKVRQSDRPAKIDPGPMVIAVPPPPQQLSPDKQAGPSRQRTTTTESTQTVCLPSVAQRRFRAFSNGTDTPTTADTFQTASSSSPHYEAFSPIFHAHPHHTRHTPHPILVPSSLPAGSHVSLTASQPGTASSSGGTTDFSSVSSPVRPLHQVGDTSFTSMGSGSGWEASSSRNSMDVYVETARNGREGSESDAETPTIKTMDTHAGRPVDANRLSRQSAEVQLGKPLRTSTSISSASTNASFDFKAHASFRASNPFALDTSLGWSDSERGSSPATASIDETRDLSSAGSGSMMATTDSDVKSIPSRFALTHDDDEEDDERRAEWESRMELDQAELKMSSSGTQSASLSASDSLSSLNSYLSGSSGSGQDATIISRPSREAQSTFGRSTSITGLASRLRARLNVAPSESTSSRGSSSSGLSSTLAEAPARPPMRRIESERKAAKAKQAVAKEIDASQSQPLPERSSIGKSKHTSLPPGDDPATTISRSSTTPQPASTNHTLSDIYNNYRGKLGSSSSEQDHYSKADDKRSPLKKLLSRRSQSLSYTPAQRAAFDPRPEADTSLPSLDSTLHTGASDPVLQRRSRILEEEHLGEGMQTQDSSLTTDPSSTSGSLLSCLSSNSEIEPVLMTPHMSSCLGPSRIFQAEPSVEHGFGASISGDLNGHQFPIQDDQGKKSISSEARQEETSIGATAIARRRRAYTLRGEMSTDLGKAKNPIPIKFFIGDAGDDMPPSPRHGRAVTSPIVRTETDKEDSRSPPSTPFFPKTTREPDSKNSFTRMEVPLPLHNSPSTQSMMQAYDGVDLETSNKDEQYAAGRETVSPMLQVRNSIRKRSLSLKRSTPQLRVDTSVGPPSIPLSRVKSERAGSASPVRGAVPPPIPIYSGSEITRHKSSFASSLPESSPISSKDYFKTERYNDTQFTMNDDTDTRNWKQNQTAEMDEWGFVGNSPVPAIFATKRADPKMTAKLEQNILVIVTKPTNSASVKKIRKIIWEQSIPPSLRCRVWNWLLPSFSASRAGPYRVIADQVVVPVRKDEDLPLYKQLGTHRAIINGTFPVQEMAHVFACRHPKISLPFDITWIAAIFISQSFDTEQAYWLYESLLNRLAGEFKPIAIRVTSVILPQLLAKEDPQLHTDLSSKGFDSASYGALLVSWYPSIFASALPFPTVLRLMDLVIVEGPTLLLRAALAVFMILSKRLIGSADKDAILRQLLQPSADELVSPESLVKMMAKISLSDKVVEGLKNKALASLANQKRN